MSLQRRRRFFEPPLRRIAAGVALGDEPDLVALEHRMASAEAKPVVDAPEELDDVVFDHIGVRREREHGGVRR